MSNSNKSSQQRKRKLKHRIRTFSQSVGLSPMRILISAILVLGIGALILTIVFSNKEENNVAVPGELKQKQQSLDLDKRLQAMVVENPGPDENFLAVIDRMNKFEEELDEIESKGGLTDLQQETVNRVRLRNKTVNVMTMKRNNVDVAAEKADLIQFCENLLNAEDDLMKEGAQFWLCVLPTSEFKDSPNAETLENFIVAANKYADGYINNPDHASTLAKLLFGISTRPHETDVHWKKSFDVLAQQLDRSKYEPIRDLGVKLKSLKLFGKFKLPTLSERILWGDPRAKDDLRGMLDVLAQNLDTDIRTWITIIKAYESFLATDKIEETGTAWQMTSSLANRITDPEKKKTLLEVLKRQQARAMTIGSQFDSSGTTQPTGNSIKRTAHAYTAVIFCDKSVASIKCLTQLGIETKDMDLGYRPVIAFDSPLSEEDIKSINLIPSEIAIVDHKTSMRYREAIPVDFFPYIILTDRAGKVLFANLDIAQIPARIAKVEADKRR